MIPRIKICCIANREEANLAIRMGASALGLVGPMPSGPGVISNESIADIATIIPPSIGSFLLTSETSPSGILQHHKKVLTNTVQMVDALSEGAYSDIREAIGPVKLVQVIHVIGEESLEQAQMLANEVDALLLDSGNPNLAVKELGGTGRVHNWKISRKIVDSVQIPVFLAGGLNPKNARAAMEEVQPFGLDLCSGVRTDGKLDPYKLEDFFNSVYSIMT